MNLIVKEAVGHYTLINIYQAVKSVKPKNTDISFFNVIINDLTDREVIVVAVALKMQEEILDSTAALAVGQ
jgi:predicted DNA binding protein